MSWGWGGGSRNGFFNNFLECIFSKNQTSMENVDKCFRKIARIDGFDAP